MIEIIVSPVALTNAERLSIEGGARAIGKQLKTEGGVAIGTIRALLVDNDGLIHIHYEPLEVPNDD